MTRKASSAKFQSAQAELDRQWNNKNLCQPNPGVWPLESPCTVWSNLISRTAAIFRSKLLEFGPRCGIHTSTQPNKSSCNLFTHIFRPWRRQPTTTSARCGSSSARTRPTAPDPQTLTTQPPPTRATPSQTRTQIIPSTERRRIIRYFWILGFRPFFRGWRNLLFPNQP